MKKILAALTCLVLTVTCLSGCSRSSTDQVVVGLTYIPNIQFAPFYNAQSAGWGEQNSGITIRHHGSSEGLFTALAADQEQFVVAGGDEILQARSQGVDVVAVATYYRQYPARIIVPEASPIQTMADLKGHSVGVPGKYGESWFALLVGLQKAGLAENDIDVQEIGYTALAALTTGQVEALVGFSNSDLVNFQTAGVAVRAIDPQADLVSICLAVSSTYAQAHPDTVSVVISGMTEGMQEALDNPTQTLDTAATYIPSFYGDIRAQAEKVLPATTALFVDASGHLDPHLDPDGWTHMADVMGTVGLIPTGTDPSSAFSNDYIKQ